jgi:integrase
LISQWIANGRRPILSSKGLLITDMVDSYVAYAFARFRKRGKPTGTATRAKMIGEEFKAIFGDEPASEFSPKKLKTVRLQWIDKTRDKGIRGGGPLSKATIKQYTDTIIRMFSWAVEEELVPASVVHALREVGPLNSRDGVRNPEPVGVPNLAAVEAALSRIRGQAKTMCRLMMLTAMRPGEVCHIRPCDLEMDVPEGEPWLYRVPDEIYKSEHTGKSRTVPIGPKAQAILRPLIERAKKTAPGGTAYLFRPERHGGAGPRRGINSAYRPGTLACLVYRACNRAGVEHWAPNQLRHLAASEIEARFGQDASRAILGHSDDRTTAIYTKEIRERAELERAVRVAREIG